jgi:hypothetical protein
LQPSNAGGFRRVAFTKPINDKGKENIQQVNPALRLQARRYASFNMKKEIADIIFQGLVIDLYKAERAIFINKEIGKHALLINKSKPEIRRLFILIQNLTFNEAILSLSRIYDKPDKNYPNRCVLRIFKFLKELGDNAPIANNKEKTLEQLKYLRFNAETVKHLLEDDHIQFAQCLYLDFETEYIQTEFQSKLKKLKLIRDKMLAHNEDEKIIQKFQWEEFDELISFIKKINGIIGWAYLNTDYMFQGIYRLSGTAEREKHIITNTLKELKILNEA